jgi:hypothetical protein
MRLLYIWNYLQRANAFLRQQNPGTFIILYEDPFDMAAWSNFPRFGWHKKWNRHSFLFLDGHADNMLTETGDGNSGRGWKSPNYNWYNNPEDPDYRYRAISPVGAQPPPK